MIQSQTWGMLDEAGRERMRGCLRQGVEYLRQSKAERTPGMAMLCDSVEALLRDDLIELGLAVIQLIGLNQYGRINSGLVALTHAVQEQIVARVDPSLN